MMPTPPVAYNSLGAVISIAVLGSLLVALIALVIGYRHWQKGKERQHLAVAYSSGRLDSSEYVMPGELAWRQGHVGVARGSCFPLWTRETGRGELEGEKGSEGRSQPSGDRIPRPGSDRAAPMSVSAFSDIPASYSRCYSNPSYHTLSQCSPSPPPPNKVSARGGVRCGQTDRRIGVHLLLWRAPPCMFLSMPFLSPLRFLVVSCLPASRPLSGWGESMGVIITPACPLTGSTAESPLLGVRTGVGVWRPRPQVRPGTQPRLSVCVCRRGSGSQGWGRLVPGEGPGI